MHLSNNLGDAIFIFEMSIITGFHKNLREDSSNCIQFKFDSPNLKVNFLNFKKICMYNIKLFIAEISNGIFVGRDEYEDVNKLTFDDT